jgi:hypothetical protein
MIRAPLRFGLTFLIAYALHATLACGGSEPAGSGGASSTTSTGASSTTSTGTGTSGECGVGEHDAGLGLCVDDSPLVIENLSATLKPDQFGDYNLQLVFAAKNTSSHAMAKCNGGSLEDDKGYHASVNISGSCGGGEVCPDDGSSDQVCTLAPGATTGLYTLGVYALPSKLPQDGAPITLTLKGFLDDATPITAIAQTLVVK